MARRRSRFGDELRPSSSRSRAARLKGHRDDGETRPGQPDVSSSRFPRRGVPATVASCCRRVGDVWAWCDDATHRVHRGRSSRWPTRARTLSQDETTVCVGAQGASAYDRTTARQAATNDDTQIGLVATGPIGRSGGAARRHSSSSSIVVTFGSSRLRRGGPAVCGRSVSPGPLGRRCVCSARPWPRRHRVLVQRGDARTHQSGTTIATRLRRRDRRSIRAGDGCSAIAGPGGVAGGTSTGPSRLDAACRVADRNLTPAERETYLAGLDNRGDTCQSFD